MIATPSLRLLYVDDDVGLARLVQKNLERRGYAVETAQDGAGGLARLAAGGIDAVALDHYMPGQDGLETLAAIQALPDPPPVIYVTATQEGRVAVAALKAGAADYVVKDVQGEFLTLLAAAVEQAVAAVRLRRAHEAAQAEVRAARDRFEALAAERAVLLHEVNHRVGNSLQIIAALLHLQASAAQTAEVKTELQAANKRVMAVAQVHRRLYTSDDVQSVALDQYLDALAEDLRQSADGGDSASLSLDAESVEVDPDRAVAVIVTELVLNALKYAYPDGQVPIRLKLHAEGEARARLSVEDDGVGRSMNGKPPKGLGQAIVRAMASKLNAEWGYDDAHRGTRVTLAFDRAAPERPQSAAA